jgi:hypothetical protein|tara:strand:+ start:826 stop:1008 length:183 start_codon:yes stop_codon:yes gene_type:complete
MNDFDRWIMNNPWKICVIYPVSIIATGLLVMFLSMSVIETLVKEKRNEQSQLSRDDKTKQ